MKTSSTKVGKEPSKNMIQKSSSQTNISSSSYNPENRKKDDDKYDKHRSTNGS